MFFAILADIYREKRKGGSIPSINGENFAGMYGLCWIAHSKIQILQYIYKANLKCCKQP